MRALLPAGNSLEPEQWLRRHRVILALLWLHVPGVALFAFARHQTVVHSMFEASLVLCFALVALLPNLTDRVRSVFATLGLVTSSAALVHLSDGLIEMHFHFFVVVAVVSLYQSWEAFLAAVAFTVAHHGVMGSLDPAAVYNHPAALAGSWKWALVHGGFLLAESAACLVAWRLNEVALSGERQARQALERSNEEIEYRAFHDMLTGLANRALFVDRLAHALILQQRTHEPVALLYLDLDDFKMVNDTLGHTVGDEMLVQVAARLQGVFRASDTIARLGGDEFAVLLEDTDVRGARMAADQVLESLKDPLRVNGTHLLGRASIGVVASTHAEGSEDLMRHADIAMYAAKREGKHAYRIFDQTMQSSVTSRLELESELAGAIEQEQFFVLFQPLVDLATGTLAGIEALVRWNHPKHGVLLPEAFIAFAEETGLIVPLGEWVLANSLGQAAALEREFGRPLHLGVNLSASQLRGDIVGTVGRLLEAHGVPGTNLVLEITETSVMMEGHGTVEKLRQLREMGVRIAIDDFGTGYSSLAYLKRLPIDILKIDRSFVHTIDDGPEESALAHAIIKLARLFGLRTVGEGIELPGEAEVLRELGCDSGQGFHFGRPMQAERLVEEVRSGRIPLVSISERTERRTQPHQALPHQGLPYQALPLGGFQASDVR